MMTAPATRVPLRELSMRLRHAWVGLGALFFLPAPFLAQEPPGESFLPFEDRAYRLVNSIAFSPAGDEMYFALFAREVREHRGQPVGDAPEVGLFRSRRIGDRWSEPEILPLTESYDSYEPTISPDGSLMVFNSRRPYPDGRTPEVNDLWMSVREGEEWGAPRRLAELTSFDMEESYAAFGGEATLVFLRATPSPDGSPRYDLFESTYEDGAFSRSTRHPVSSDQWGEGDPWLSVDGNTLVFTRWDPDLPWEESVDLYIAFREDGLWSEPVPLANLNTDGADFGAAGSADGRWFYYKTGSRFHRIPLSWLSETYR